MRTRTLISTCAVLALVLAGLPQSAEARSSRGYSVSVSLGHPGSGSYVSYQRVKSDRGRGHGGGRYSSSHGVRNVRSSGHGHAQGCSCCSRSNYHQRTRVYDHYRYRLPRTNVYRRYERQRTHYWPQNYRYSSGHYYGNMRVYRRDTRRGNAVNLRTHGR
ncbi:hypothetical protein ACFL34_04505 [Candidatus Sumerlaeota bacterium]